jgi:3-oxoacyl-[acyl-carrier-protein] synthase II
MDFDLPPSRCSRPFDLHRRGGIISEGAVVLVMESLAHALGRGAFPWFEVLGCSSCGDHQGTEAGTGFAHTMAEAMANAGKQPRDIDYISAHGPSHPVIDRVETQMIKQVFGSRAHAIPVSSIKGVIGNPLAAAGPLQLVGAALGMHRKMVPPTANYEVPDPLCDLDYVPHHAYAMSTNHAMVNVHGLGGGNSSMVIGKVNGA